MNKDIDIEGLKKYSDFRDIANLLSKTFQNYSLLYISKSDDSLPNDELSEELFNLKVLSNFFSGDKL